MHMCATFICLYAYVSDFHLFAYADFYLFVYTYYRLVPTFQSVYSIPLFVHIICLFVCANPGSGVLISINLNDQVNYVYAYCSVTIFV